MSDKGTPGAGFFRAGAIGMIVVGLMHASAHLAPTPAEALPAIDAMRGFAVTMLGLTWDLHDAYETLSLSYAWLSILLGVLGLVVVQRLGPEPRTLRLLALLFAAGAAGLVVISAIYSVAPPIHLYALTAALFAISAVRAR